MHNPRIESLKNEYDELLIFFRENGQLSFELYLNNNYKKSLLLSAASYFETIITDIIIAYARARSKNDKKLVALIEGKTLSRQYHTLFDWDRQNANKFFSLFGDEAKNEARQLIEDRKLLDSEKAFLLIGKERNNLVHKNYIEATINYTFEEIYAQYLSACIFIDFLIEILPSS